MFVWYLNYSLVAKIFYKSLVDGAQADSMTKLRKLTEANPFVICKTNLLQKKKINMLFAGLGSVRKVKSCDLGLENAALGLRPRAAFSRPRS